MTTEQLVLFHKNYEYMWNKLSTTHYYARCDAAAYKAERTQHLVGCNLLPSYQICSHCMNDDYEPSLKIVHKIVQFYNENIAPPVNTYQFLNEDLQSSDNERYRSSSIYDKRFIGTYYGYYLSASTENKLLGAVLKIYEENSLLKALFVSGIRNDTELTHYELFDVISNPSSVTKKFETYFNKRDPENQRCYLYSGDVELTENSLTVFLKGSNEDSRKLTLTFNTDCFTNAVKRDYYGGLAFALSSNDGPLDTRFYKLGIINSHVGIISLQNKNIIELLRINYTGNSISLTSAVDREWYEVILNNITPSTN